MTWPALVFNCTKLDSYMHPNTVFMMRGLRKRACSALLLTAMLCLVANQMRTPVVPVATSMDRTHHHQMRPLHATRSTHCVCSSRKAGRFLDPGCDQICAADWPSDAESLESPSGVLRNEPSLVLSGERYMRMTDIAFCVTMRDREDLVPSLRRFLERVSESFMSAQVFVTENDSRPGLRAALHQWNDDIARNSTSSIRRVTVDSHVLCRGRCVRSKPSGRQRFGVLAKMRSACLKRLAESDFSPHTLAVLDVDHDIDLGSISTLDIAHAFGLKTRPEWMWNVACANGVTRRAFPVHLHHRRTYSPGWLRDWGFRDTLAFRSRDTTLGLVTHQRIAHLPRDVPLEVQSCFGGLALYSAAEGLEVPAGAPRYPAKLHARCAYQSDGDCEHVSFHRCLRERLNWRVFLIPKLVLRYYT